MNSTISSPSNKSASEVQHLFVLANVQQIVYGSPNPTLTFQVYGDGDPANTLSASVSCTAPNARNASPPTYAITCSGPATPPSLPAVGVSYNIAYNNGTVHAPGVLTITPLPITVAAVTDSKMYDGTTNSTKVPSIAPALIAGDAASFTQAFDSKNAGARTLLSSGSVNDGNGGQNYAVTLVNAAGSITPAPLTITAQTNTKRYDATSNASAVPVASGLKGTDTVTGLAETYDNPNVGQARTLSVSPGYTVNDGNGGQNYVPVTLVTNTTGVISSAPLTITAVTNTKTYDKTTGAAAVPVVSGLKGTDTVTGVAERYDTANAGSGKTLSVSAYTVNDGNGGKNYTVTTASVATGVINPAPLTITAQANTKTYDKTINAAAVPTVSGMISGDTTTGLAETYDAANAGSGKTLSVSAYTVNDGNAGKNYAVTTVANTTGIINPAPLRFTAKTNTKIYDATTSAAAVPTVSGLIAPDTVTGLAEAYDTPNVGSGKTLSVSTYSVNDGNAGKNYSVTTVPNTTGSILWTFGLSPLKSPANLGSAVPVNWTIQNAAGAFISDLSTLREMDSVFNGPAPRSGCVASLTGPSQILYSPATGATGGSNFRLVSNGYQFNWDSTTATATGPGCYTLKLTLNDGTSKVTNAVQLK